MYADKYGIKPAQRGSVSYTNCYYTGILPTY